MNVRFPFGQNWIKFSENSFSAKKLAQATAHFEMLTTDIDLSRCKFLDVGFGQGIGLLLASSFGADAIGLDVDGDNIHAFQTIAEAMKAEELPQTVIGSILDDSIVFDLKKVQGLFDVVYSWGVLHHTGDMKKAILNCISLIDENGYFILAIYNKHWSSKYWSVIKYFYNISPEPIKLLFNIIFFPIISLAKFCVTGRNPWKKERGMSFYYDLIDWLGGYPYEYASKLEVVSLIEEQGLYLEKFIKAEVPTGCNEYVFCKRKS